MNDTDFESGSAVSELLFLKESGVFSERLSVEHEGNLYRIACDDYAFTVYRVNKHHGVSPGLPGWPVCTIRFEPEHHECKAPSHREDHLTCGMELADWLEIIRQHFVRESL